MSFNFLIKLRNKTDTEKKKILIIGTIVVMVTIFIVWIWLTSIFGSKKIDSTQLIVIEPIRGLFINAKNIFTK